MAHDAVSDVRDRTDIVDLVSQYVQLKKAGRSYKGLCPFHQEKTPSFIVFPDSGNFHCFGCGKGGDAFTFYQSVRARRLQRSPDRTRPPRRRPTPPRSRPSRPRSTPTANA